MLFYAVFILFFCCVSPLLALLCILSWARALAARKQLDPTKAASNSNRSEMTAEERQLEDQREVKWRSERDAFEKDRQQAEREKRSAEEETLRGIWATYDADGSGGLDAAEIKAVGEAIAPLGKLREFKSAVGRLVEEGGAGLGEEGITLAEFLAWWQEHGAEAARSNFLPGDTEMRKIFWIGGFSPFDCGGKCGCCTDPQLLDCEDFYIDPAAAVPASLKHSIDGSTFGMAVIDMNAAAERYTTPGLKQLYVWTIMAAGGTLGAVLLNACAGNPLVGGAVSGGSAGSGGVIDSIDSADGSDGDEGDFSVSGDVDGLCLKAFDYTDRPGGGSGGQELTDAGQMSLTYALLVVLGSTLLLALLCILRVHFWLEPRIDNRMRKLCAVHTNLRPGVRWQFCSEEAPGCTGRLFGRYKYVLRGNYLSHNRPKRSGRLMEFVT